MDRATFENILLKFNEARAGKGEMKIVGMTAEGNRVAVEAEANIPLKNGKVYQNTYHFLFIINDGKIVLSKEYNDSLYASSALGGLL